VAWGDYDNDGDLDIFLTSSAPGSSKLYRNDGTPPNSRPSLPSGLASEVVGNTAVLSWDAADDVETAAPGLTYNVRVGSAPGAEDVVPPMADLATGFRRVVDYGNAFHGTSLVLSGLPPGTYHWSAQAVDAAFDPSAFAPEGDFLVEGVIGVGDADDLAEVRPPSAAPNPFRETVTIRFDASLGDVVRVSVYDVNGKCVGTPVSAAGGGENGSAVWDPRRCPPGVYFFEVVTREGRSVGRMLLAR
jgi:hypothetical protein